MKTPAQPLIHAWFDRPLTADDMKGLSAGLTSDAAAADAFAELTCLHEGLAAGRGRLGPTPAKKLSLTQRVAVMAAVAACLTVGVSILLRSRGGSPLPPGEASVETVHLSPRWDVVAVPPPSRTADGRAAQALDRLLGRRGLPSVAVEGRSLRELATEWEATLRADSSFAGRFDVSALGPAADEPLRFSRPPGSLRGLLSHAAAVTGGSLVIGAGELQFQPLGFSERDTRTLRFTAASSARRAVADFCGTGTIPPEWGLAPHEFAASSDGTHVAVTSTRGQLARLRAVVDSLNEPLPPCQVRVTVLSLPAHSEGSEDAALNLVRSAVGQVHDSPPGAWGLAAVFSAEQWQACESSVQRLGERVLASVNSSVPAGAWMDAGSQAPSVLRWKDESLMLRPEFSGDGHAIDLTLTKAEHLPTDEKQPGLSTSVTLWADTVAVFGLRTPAGQDGVLAVQVSLAR